MTLPTILEALPSTDIHEPLIAHDTGWFADSSDLDIDCPLVEFDLNGGFFKLLAEHGMKRDGELAGTDEYAEIDFALAGMVSTGGAVTAADTTTSFGTLATTNLEATETTVGTKEGFAMSADAATLTFTIGASFDGKMVSFALNYGLDGTETAETFIAEVGTTTTGVFEIALAKEPSEALVVLDAKLTVLG